MGFAAAPTACATPAGSLRVGRYGWKADIAQLDEMVANALAIEIGITTPLAAADPRHASGGLDDDGGIVRALVVYLKTLTLPGARARQMKLAAALPMQSAIALRWSERLPGIAVAAVLAFVAAAVAGGLGDPLARNPLLIAILIGLAIGNTFGCPDQLKPGLDFTKRYLLRLAVVLVGFRITWRLLLDLGAAPLAIAIVQLLVTLVVVLWIARKLLKLDNELSLLLAAGTAVCGASAILAVASVRRHGRDRPRSRSR